MEADKWHLQDGGLMMRPMEQMMIPTSYAKSSSSSAEKRPRPQRDHALNCPRCNSTNTKFCYYNNYSLTQPRYFCKTCRRYWTEGGSLRNVPVGGGSRKNKRPAFSTSPSPVATKSLDLNPDKCIGSQELSLTFPTAPNYLALSQFSASSGDPVAPIPSHVPSSLEFLRTGISSKGIPCYGAPPPPMAAYYTPYHHQSEMKQSLSFPMEGDSVRTLFPFGEMKPISNSGEVEHQNKEQGSSGGWWNGVLTGGSW